MFLAERNISIMYAYNSRSLQRVMLNVFPRSRRKCLNGICQKSFCCCWRKSRKRAQVLRSRAFSSCRRLCFETPYPVARS